MRNLSFKKPFGGKCARTLLLALLCLSMLFVTIMTGTRVEAARQKNAVLFSDLNENRVFVKQRASGECTLASATMLARRAAMLSGNENWDAITDNTLRSICWGPGLSWNFSVAGISISHKSLSGTSELISMLANHPEGVMIYDESYPHAILVTDYTDGQFYCSDPANCCPTGRYPIYQSLISAGAARACWYVTTRLALPVIRDDQTYTSGGLDYQVDVDDPDSLICVGAAKKKAKLVIPDMVTIDGKRYEVSEVSDKAFSSNTKLKKLTIGANVSKIDRQAFYNCRKLAAVRIDATDLVEIGTDAFSNISDEAQIMVNKLQHKDLLLGSSLDSSVQIVVNQAAESDAVSYSSKRQ